jgi:hypothetical protein
MSVRRLVFIIILTFLCSSAAFAQVAGQNINMVSGTDWPAGDPYLQRQNEPSMAVSSRNPEHLLAGANDYRTVDIPNPQARKSDGRQSELPAVLPGFPQDTSPVGTASLLHQYTVATDPTVRAGTQLVSHEVVPGHVTTFAYLQDLWFRGKAGFEATVLTMNTRAATPDEDLQIGVLLARLQDDAKNQSSYLTWGEGMQRENVAAILRRDFLVTEERADKLSGAWGRHPLLGRMYLPASRTGTEIVAQLRRLHPAGEILPAIYGCSGLVDVVTIDEVLKCAHA